MKSERTYQHADLIFKTQEGTAIWVGDYQSAENITWLQ